MNDSNVNGSIAVEIDRLICSERGADIWIEIYIYDLRISRWRYREGYTCSGCLLVGLGVGADDYMTKPFSQKELVARIRAILRRVERERFERASSTAPLVIGDAAIDVARRTVVVGSLAVELTSTEFDLLANIAGHDGAVRSRSQLIFEVWGHRDGSGDRTVDSHVRSIRRKLGDDVIRTVHGVGYAAGTPES